MRCHVAFLVAALLVGTPSPQASQRDGRAAEAAIKVGVLPFVDATTSGNRSVGADIARTLQAEMVHSTTLLPRLLENGSLDASGGFDASQAIEFGRAQHVDFVFAGTVLEARTEQSNKRGFLPTIKGQSANVDVHHLKAIVVLQGELYDVAKGARMFSKRVTGSDSSNSIGGTAYTTLGAIGNDTYQSFLDSPLGKALQAAAAEMTKDVADSIPHHS